MQDPNGRTNPSVTVPPDDPENAHRVSFSGPWLIVTALISVSAIVTVSLSRFLEWDEAVFFGQSGGYGGVAAAPPSLAPSRESGPVVLIWGMRLFASDLAETRLLWAAVSIAAIVAAYRAFERHVGRPSSIVACLTFGTFWIALIYAASFYASLLGAMFALLATAAYLTFREEPTWRRGLVMASWLAAAFWMRQVESAIVLTVILVHLVVSRPGRAVLRESWRAVAVSAVGFVFAFVVPWGIDATVRYGSVLGRIRAGQSQQYPRGLRNNLTEYGQLFLGSGHFRALHPVPGWARWSLVVAGLLAGIVLLAVLAMHLMGRGSRRLDHRKNLVALMSSLALASFSFFFFYGGVVRERYVLFGLAFSTVAVSQAAFMIGRFSTRIRTMPITLRFSSLVLVLGLWLSVNQAVAQPIQDARQLHGRVNEHIVTIVRTLDPGGSCRGIARYGAPTIQVGTGCTVTPRSTPGSALEFAEDVQDRPGMEFVVWPSGTALELPGSWDVIEVPIDRSEGRAISIYYSRDN